MVRLRGALIVLGLGICGAAFAQDASSSAPTLEGVAQQVSDAAAKGDLIWVAVAAALVLLMTPALAMFYGGMVRRTNVLSTMMHSFIAMGVISVLWLVIGYSLSFGPASFGFIGDATYALGANLKMAEPAASMGPSGAFMLFQMMFAIITPALISGAIAERMSFGAYVAFIAAWSLMVYSPVACWVWNPDGWLFKHGALDFAGGTVVHLASGVAALAAAIAVGKRRAVVRREPIPPNNITMTLIGSGILWFGWIGFNAGSALGMSDVAMNAFVSTHVAAATGMLGWLIVERLKTGKATALGAASGLVAGLVGITPGAGFIAPREALLVGLIVGAVCCLAISLKSKFGYDDSLDVVGVHGAGGFVGAVLTGVFASVEANKAIVEPALADGRLALIMKQIVAVGSVAAFSLVVSFAILYAIKAFGGLRVGEEDEVTGLDETIHGEAGYNL